MTRRGTELQVGLALIVALLVLIFGLMWFQNYQLGASYQNLQVRFEKVGGLGAGDPVEVRGMDLGKVTEVDLVDDGVLVTLRLPGSVTVRDDAEFRLGSAGIMGERMVAVEPGQGRPVDVEDRVFEGVYQPSSTDMVGTLETMNERVVQFLDRTEELIVSLQEDEVLVRTLENTARAAETATEVLEENRREIGRAATSMADLAERMGSFLEENEQELGEGIEGLARASATLDSLAGQMSDVLDGTEQVLTALNEQKGAAGRMIHDEQAGEDLVESLRQLRFLVEDLQRNPQRYLTVKIF